MCLLSLQLCQLPCIADLSRCTSPKVSKHVQIQTKFQQSLNGKSVITPGRDPYLLYLTQEAPEPITGRTFGALLNHIIHCRMPWEMASTVFAEQAMQTPYCPSA